MIPILFKEDETNFNSNGIGHLTETVTYDVREVRNGEFELFLEYPVTGRWFNEIKDFRFILAEPNEMDDDHLFRIYETVKDAATQSILVYATTKSNDLGGNLVNNVIVSNETAQQAMNKMKSSMIMASDYNFVSDIQTKSSTEWIRRNPLNCIAGEEGSLVNYWGGEIKRTNDTIYLYSRRGKDRVATIRQGKNLNGFTITSSTKGMITSIVPFFTYTPEGKEDPVTITGSIVDSPLVNNYPVKYITPVDFSSDQEIKTLAQLNTAAKTYFATMNPGCDKPSVELDVDLMQLSDSSEYEKFKALERIQLTDTVIVWVKKYNVDVEVKVTEITYNGMLQQVTNIIAGTQATDLYSDVKKSYTQGISELQKYVNGMENGIRNVIQISADGKNRIFRGYTQPDISISKLNDLWYKELGSGEVEIWIFDGAYWQPYVTAGLNEAVKAEVNKMIAQADADRAIAEQGYSDAITQGGIYTDQKASEFNGKLEIVKSDLATQVIKIDANIVKADKAISDANFAKIDAAKAIGDAANVLGLANAAKTDAGSALNTANNAITRIGAVETTTGNLTTNYNALTQTVGLKADKTVVDGINSTVEDHTLEISANASAIGFKADKTLVDTVKQTVDKHTTDIKLAADGLLLKADSTRVDTINNTVVGHTGLISANSQAISLRMTSLQVENAITAKNYVNQTTLTTTANGLQLGITEVSTALTNVDGSSVNLVKRMDELPNSWLIDSGIGSSGANKNSVMKDRITVTAGQRLHFTKNTIAGSYDNSWRWMVYNTAGAFSSRLMNSANDFVWTVPAGVGFIWVSYPTMSNPIIVEETATVERVVTIEANINGINTLVANKADKSQITQLAGQISTKVESATYNSKMAQLDSAINLRVVQSDVTSAILEDKTIKDTRADNQLPSWYNTNYPKQTVEEFKQRTTMGVAGTATYGQLTTKILWNSTSGGAITQMFYSADGVFQRVSNSAYTAWLGWDKVAEAGQLISQINISTEGILLQGKRIQLDGDVTMTTAFVTKLDVLTLAAVYADIATLKTKVLTADVITATMIKNDTAMITTLFATDANVNILTAKTAFINSVKAVTISADKITAGTLNAANVNIINMNAGNITSGTLVGIKIQSPAKNSTFEVLGGDARFTSSTGLKMTLSPSGIYGYDANGVTRFQANEGLVTSSSFGTSVSNVYLAAKEGVTSGDDGEARVVKYSSLGGDGLASSYRYLSIRANALMAPPTANAYIGTDKELRVMSEGLTSGGVYRDVRANGYFGSWLSSTDANMWIGVDSGLQVVSKESINSSTKVFRDLRAQNIYGSGFISSTTNAYIGTDGELRVENVGFSDIYRNVRAGGYYGSFLDTTATNMYIGVAGEARVTTSSDRSVYKPIRASAFTVSSGREYKKNIETYQESALDLIMGTKVKTYHFNEDLDNLDYKHVGLIAQEAPLEIINFNGGNSLDLYAMSSLLWKGEQELLDRIKVLETKIEKMESAV